MPIAPASRSSSSPKPAGPDDDRRHPRVLRRLHVVDGVADDDARGVAGSPIFFSATWSRSGAGLVSSTSSLVVHPSARSRASSRSSARSTWCGLPELASTTRWPRSLSATIELSRAGQQRHLAHQRVGLPHPPLARVVADAPRPRPRRARRRAGRRPCRSAGGSARSGTSPPATGTPGTRPARAGSWCRPGCRRRRGRRSVRGGPGTQAPGLPTTAGRQPAPPASVPARGGSRRWAPRRATALGPDRPARRPARTHRDLSRLRRRPRRAAGRRPRPPRRLGVLRPAVRGHGARAARGRGRRSGAPPPSSPWPTPPTTPSTRSPATPAARGRPARARRGAGDTPDLAGLAGRAPGAGGRRSPTSPPTSTSSTCAVLVESWARAVQEDWAAAQARDL